MGRILVLTGSLLHIIAYLYAAPRHAIDLDWNDHARFHIVQAIFWIIGLDLVSASLVFFKTYLGHAHVKWILTLIFLSAHGGYFVSMLIVPEGKPPELSSHLALLVVGILYFIGLVMIFKQDHINEKD